MSTSDHEMERALGTEVGKLLACRMFNMGCPGSVEDAGARARFQQLTTEQRMKLIDGIEEEEARRQATASSLKNTLEGRGDGLQLRGFADPEPAEPGRNESVATEKIIKALNCAVESVVRELSSLEGDGQVTANSLQSDLDSIRNDLKAPLTGKDNVHKIRNVALSHQAHDQRAEIQQVADLLVSRNEQTGDVFIHVIHTSTKRAGVIARLFGKKTSTTDSQNALVIDKDGNIVSHEVTGPVKRCLAGK